MVICQGTKGRVITERFYHREYSCSSTHYSSGIIKVKVFIRFQGQGHKV